MALINRPIYEHFGARHLGVKGPGALTTLEEGVMGTLPLDLSADPLYWYIQGMRIFSKNKQGSAASGKYSFVGLAIGDTDLEVLIRIISIDTSRSIGSGQEYQLMRTARTSVSSDPGVYGAGTDTRIPEGQQSMGIILSGNETSTLGTVLAQYNSDADPDIITNQIPLIISPGQCIRVVNNVSNTAISATFTWVEVPAYKAEL